MTTHNPTDDDVFANAVCSTVHRTWFHEELPGIPDRGDVLVIMKQPSWPDTGNPSLAEARRMATDLGFSNLYVGNLFGARAPKPRLLNDRTYEEAVTEGNDLVLEIMATGIDLVVAAWGDPNGLRPEWYRRRVGEVVELVGRDRFTSFGTTASGQPRHCYSWRFDRAPLSEWGLSLLTGQR